jgi:hypothetical protein
MPARSWMQENITPRLWAKRTRGRRASDRHPSLEAILVAAVIVAWGWGAYEVVRLFIR